MTALKDGPTTKRDVESTHPRDICHRADRRTSGRHARHPLTPERMLTDLRKSVKLTHYSAAEASNGQLSSLNKLLHTWDPASAT